MTTLVDLLRTLLLPVILFLGAISLALWWLSRFWAPMYIHLLAATSSLIAALLVWRAWVVDDPLKGRAFWMMVIFSRASVPDVWVLWRQNHQEASSYKS
jgi:hypothetical protein